MNNVNYDKKQTEIIKSLSGNKPRLLIHSCCAPCSSYCLEKVVPHFLVDVLYFNPNITDSEEYNKRLNEQISFVNTVYGESVSVIKGNYNINDFYTAVKGEEDLKEGEKRCKICYLLRLEETARIAKKLGYEYFTSTLSVSPYKNAKWLNEIGEELSKKYGVKYLYADFKKGGGYLKSIELSKKYDLYRQDYCGCEFSKNK
ncbi:MAG: epoxyqueuosine reductase QueH [Clostridia bacterium]|nr:epoxyqueuosine reductase QueH [Clostridia bacterium]